MNTFWQKNKEEKKSVGVQISSLCPTFVNHNMKVAVG